MCTVKYILYNIINNYGWNHIKSVYASNELVVYLCGTSQICYHFVNVMKE